MQNMETTVIENEDDTPQAVEDEQNQEPYVPPKRGPGRPPKNPNKVAVTIPKPPAFQIKRPQTFVEYWKTLNKEQAQTCLVRVYRLWPVINNKQLKPEANNDIDTIPGEDCFFGPPDEWEDSMLHRYGSGWYQIYINQDRASICRVVMKTRQDFANHPPKIMSGTLVEGHPDNAGYIQYLKDRGIYKDDRQEADNMQQGEAINKLTDTVISMANRQHVPVPPPPSNDRVISELVKPMMTMMEKANESAIETVKAQHSGNDPLKTLASVGSLLKDLRGGDAPHDDGMKVMLQETMATNRMLMETMLKRDTAPPKNDLKDFLENMKLAREAFGPAEKEAGEETATKSSGGIAQSLLDAAPVVLPGIINLIDRGIRVFELSRLPAPQQLQQTVSQQPGPANPYGNGTSMQQAVQAEQSRQAAGGTGAPPSQVQQTQTQQPIVETQPTVNINPTTGVAFTPDELIELEKKRQQYAQFAPFLSSMAPAIIAHLSDKDKDGVDFAQWLIDGYGRLTYEQIQAVGPDMLLGAMQSYAPLWQQIGGIEVRVKEFISDFMNYDELVDKDEDEPEEKEKK